MYACARLRTWLNMQGLRLEPITLHSPIVVGCRQQLFAVMGQEPMEGLGPCPLKTSRARSGAIDRIVPSPQSVGRGGRTTMSPPLVHVRHCDPSVDNPKVCVTPASLQRVVEANRWLPIDNYGGMATCLIIMLNMMIMMITMMIIIVVLYTAK